MLERIYFWKGKGQYITPFIATVAIFTASFIIAGGASAWWYYGVKVPADKKRAMEQLALRKQQADLASVAAFYKKSLTGADIEQTITLLGEIRRSTLAMSALGIPVKSENFICDTKSCSFGFKLSAGSILTLPVIDFFGHQYAASVPVKKEKESAPLNDFEYTRMALPLKQNALLDSWARNKGLRLHSCNEIISYVNTYNSLLNVSKNNRTLRDGAFIFKSYPSSSVKQAEKSVGGKLKFRGMMSAAWEMKISSDSDFFYTRAPEINAQIALYKQAYRDAFLIRKIESTDKGISISGGLVCKV